MPEQPLQTNHATAPDVLPGAQNDAFPGEPSFLDKSFVVAVPHIKQNIGRMILETKTAGLWMLDLVGPTEAQAGVVSVGARPIVRKAIKALLKSYKAKKLTKQQFIKLSKEVVKPKKTTRTELETLAKQHGLEYTGPWEDIGHMFTDLETKSSFVVRDVTKVGEKTAKIRAGYKTPIGGGEPPKSGLVVANIGADGKIYYGEPGEVHFSLSLRYGKQIRETEKLEPGEGTWTHIGWADKTGKFLTREEALPTTKVRSSIKGELDALDYREQILRE